MINLRLSDLKAEKFDTFCIQVTPPCGTERAGHIFNTGKIMKKKIEYHSEHCLAFDTYMYFLKFDDLKDIAL